MIPNGRKKISPKECYSILVSTLCCIGLSFTLFIVSFFKWDLFPLVAGKESN